MEKLYSDSNGRSSSLEQHAWKSAFCSTAAVISLLFMTFPVHAATISVSAYLVSGGGVVEDNPGDGLCSLIEAINAANTDSVYNECSAGSGDDLIVLPGNESFRLYSVNNSTDGPNGLPVIADNLSISGNGSTIYRGCAGFCVLPEFRLFYVSSGVDLTLDQITLLYGDADSLSTGAAGTTNGGALLSKGGGSVVTIKNSTVSNNKADCGGGLAFMEDGAGKTTAIIENCTITNNVTYDTSKLEYGGGIWVHESNLTMTGTTVSDNTSKSSGGGIAIQKVAGGDGGIITISNSTITQNRATARGGGIFCTSGVSATIITQPTVSITDSVIDNNIAVNDAYGGIGLESSNLIAERSSISGNTAGTLGTGIDGGIGAAIGHGGGSSTRPPNTVQLRNCTISGNVSNRQESALNSPGSAIFSMGYVNFSLYNTTVTNNGTVPDSTNYKSAVYIVNAIDVRNTIIAGNRSDADCHNNTTFSSNISNFFGDSSCDGTADGDPRLGPLQDNGGKSKTHALLSGSAAIDAGNNTSCLTVDQRGIQRPEGASCDIGSFELEKGGWFVIPGQGKKAVIFSL